MKGIAMFFFVLSAVNAAFALAGFPLSPLSGGMAVLLFSVGMVELSEYVRGKP